MFDFYLNKYYFNSSKILAMKKIGILLLSFIFISACSNNDDNPQIDGNLSGTWMLTSVSCFCIDEPESKLNEYSINFKTSQNTIDIQNPNGESFYIAENGSYNYNIANNKISLDGVFTSFNYSIKNNILTLEKIDNPQIADDELILVFKKLILE